MPAIECEHLVPDRPLAKDDMGHDTLPLHGGDLRGAYSERFEQQQSERFRCFGLDIG